MIKDLKQSLKKVPLKKEDCSFEGLKDGISVSSHSGNLCFYPTQVATSPLIYHHSIQYQVMSQAKELKSSLTNNTQNLYC